ncbi:MAG: PKD domain-containing protein [Caldilineaceae bacterium]
MKIYRILKLSPTLLTLLLCLLIAGTALAAGEQLRQGAFTGGGGPMQANNIALHSSIGQFASRTVQTGSLSLCSGILCGATAASAPVEDAPISGLTATNSGPTTPGNVVSLVASISSGSNVAYAWDFGDGSSGVGAIVSHQYAITGTYEAWVVATNCQGSMEATTTVLIEQTPRTPPGGAGETKARFFLPLIQVGAGGSPQVVSASTPAEEPVIMAEPQNQLFLPIIEQQK